MKHADVPFGQLHAELLQYHCLLVAAMDVACTTAVTVTHTACKMRWRSRAAEETSTRNCLSNQVYETKPKHF